MALDAANQNWCIHLLFVDQEESQGVMRPIQILFVFAYLVVIKKWDWWFLRLCLHLKERVVFFIRLLLKSRRSIDDRDRAVICCHIGLLSSEAPTSLEHFAKQSGGQGLLTLVRLDMLCQLVTIVQQSVFLTCLICFEWEKEAVQAIMLFRWEPRESTFNRITSSFQLLSVFLTLINGFNQFLTIVV